MGASNTERAEEGNAGSGSAPPPPNSTCRLPRWLLHRRGVSLSSPHGSLALPPSSRRSPHFSQPPAPPSPHHGISPPPPPPLAAIVWFSLSPPSTLHNHTRLRRWARTSLPAGPWLAASRSPLIPTGWRRQQPHSGRPERRQEVGTRDAAPALAVPHLPFQGASGLNRPLPLGRSKPGLNSRQRGCGRQERASFQPLRPPPASSFPLCGALSGRRESRVCRGCARSKSHFSGSARAVLPRPRSQQPPLQHTNTMQIYILKKYIKATFWACPFFS